MSETPTVAPDEYRGYVAKWRDRYDLSSRGRWKPVELITMEEEEDHEGRLAAKLGIGIAGVLCVLFLQAMKGLFVASSVIPAFLTPVVVVVSALGAVSLILAAIEWLRFRNKTALAEAGTLWGAAQRMTGARSFIDLDAAG